MVGLSGGKDSWALIQILDVLQKRAPIDFSLVAVNIDSGYEGYEHHKLTETCAARGWELHVEHTNIGETIEDILDVDATPCSLCARLRRGALYRLAKTRSARPRSRSGITPTISSRRCSSTCSSRARSRRCRRGWSPTTAQHVVIRPLVYVLESEARAYAKASELPIIGCCCPACGDLSLQRQRVKRLIAAARGRAPGDQELDAARPGQRRPAPPARPPAATDDRGQVCVCGRQVPGLAFPLQLTRK